MENSTFHEFLNLGGAEGLIGLKIHEKLNFQKKSRPKKKLSPGPLGPPKAQTSKLYGFAHGRPYSPTVGDPACRRTQPKGRLWRKAAPSASVSVKYKENILKLFPWGPRGKPRDPRGTPGETKGTPGDPRPQGTPGEPQGTPGDPRGTPGDPRGTKCRNASTQK